MISDSSIVPSVKKDLETIANKRSRRRRRSIIREFCLNTSVHVLSKVARSKTTRKRIFWSIAFTSSCGLMMYFVVKAILTYFKHPTHIDVTYQSEWPQAFPAISFCNLSPIRFDQFLVPFLKYIKEQNWTDTNDSSILLQLHANFVPNFFVDLINRNKSFATYFFPLSSMLYSCSFNSAPCTEANFTTFMSSTFGLCHTFNAKVKGIAHDGIRDGNLYDGSGTLSLGLYVHSHQYVPFLTDSAGVIVLVHDNNQVPQIETSGLELSPGYKHRLGYRKKKIKFLSSPFTECTMQISPAMQAMLNSYENTDYSYSETICYKLCQQTYTYQKCGCTHPYLWNMRTITLPGTDKIIIAPLCEINNPCLSLAVITFFSSMSLLQKYCASCSEQCSVTDFIIQKSNSKTPLEWQMNSIKMFVENSSVQLPDNWSTTWHEHISTNYLVVSVVRETNIVETSTQKQAMTLVDILSSVGGQIGLWAGLSILSVVEVIEMIYRLIRY